MVERITSAINLVTEDGNCELHPPLTWLRRMVIIIITSAIKLVTEDGNYDEFYQPNDPFGVRVTILTQSWWRPSLWLQDQHQGLLTNSMMHTSHSRSAKISCAGAWLIFGGGENNICHGAYAYGDAHTWWMLCAYHGFGYMCVHPCRWVHIRFAWVCEWCGLDDMCKHPW